MQRRSSTAGPVSSTSQHYGQQVTQSAKKARLMTDYSTPPPPMNGSFSQSQQLPPSRPQSRGAILVPCNSNNNVAPNCCSSSGIQFPNIGGCQVQPNYPPCRLNLSLENLQQIMPRQEVQPQQPIQQPQFTSNIGTPPGMPVGQPHFRVCQCFYDILEIDDDIKYQPAKVYKHSEWALSLAKFKAPVVKMINQATDVLVWEARHIGVEGPAPDPRHDCREALRTSYLMLCERFKLTKDPHLGEFLAAGRPTICISSSLKKRFDQLRVEEETRLGLTPKPQRRNSTW